jgi:hypothetical protein
VDGQPGSAGRGCIGKDDFFTVFIWAILMPEKVDRTRMFGADVRNAIRTDSGVVIGGHNENAFQTLRESPSAVTCV